MKPQTLIFTAVLLLFGKPSPAAPAPAALGPKLTGWTYRTTARPLSERWKDPGNRLNDGKVGRKAGVAIWRGNDVVFDLDLAGPCRVQAVRVWQHRHNLNYKLDHIAVSARRAGGWRELARRKGFFGPTKTMDFVFTVRFPPVYTGALRIVFSGVGVVSLSEIAVFGRRAAAEPRDHGPYADVPFLDRTGPVAREQDLDADGVPEVVLENRFVRLVLTPAQGGVCRSLRLKPGGEELVYAGESGYGLLRDQLWKPKYSFADRVYSHRIANSATGGSAELWTVGTGGMMSFTEIRRRITLRRGSSVIRVHTSLTNQPSSQTDYEYGLWFHNWLGVPGAVNTYYYPTLAGVKTVTLDPTTVRKGRDVWHRDPARGWTAVLSDRGVGLAVELPYKYLNLLYSWYGLGSPAATLEWRFNRVLVKAGDRLEADFTLIPFRGLDRVDGVVGDVIGQIDAIVGPPRRLKTSVRLLNPAGGRADGARVALRTEKTDATKPLGAVTLSPGNIAQFAAEVTVPGPGAYAVMVTLEENGKTIGSFERPVFIGGANFAYRLEPECEQVGEREEAAVGKPEHEISAAVVTPHVPWARPFAGGRLRALVLMDDMNCREAVELAERLDLDLDYVKFRTTLDKELLYQGDQSILTLDAARQRLLLRLKTREYDVMILAGFKWDFHFTPEIRKAILDKVRKGTGLILIQPDGFTPAMAAELPAAGVAKTGNAGRRMNSWFRWSPAGTGPLVAGLDWSRFPVTRRHEYATPPRGRVVATIGNDHAPLLVLSGLGKGRVVSATWDTLTHQLSYRGYSALTPILSYRGGWLRPEFAQLPDGYQEWWFALLTRLTAWAAGRDTGVSITAAPPVTADIADLAKTRLTVAVRAAKPRSGASVETHWFNARGDALGTVRTRIDLSIGQSEVDLPAPAGVTHGANTACFIVRDQGGAALAWGFTTLHVRTPVWIARLELSPDTLLPAGGIWQKDGAVETGAFRPERPLEARVGLSAPAPAALAVDWEVCDSRGRVLARATDEMAGGGAHGTRRFGPFLLVHQGITVTARLRNGQTLLDVRRVRAVAYRPRVWERFWFTSWGGQYLWRTKYLFDFNNRLVRDLGVDVSFWGDTELNTGKVRDNAYWGIDHAWLGLLSYLGKGIPDFKDRDFASKAAAFAKTRDRKQLVRRPSLADPEWRSTVRRKLIERVRRTLPQGGAVDYCMGDEMSLTYYTRFFDFDWSADSLEAFRREMHGKYGAIEALNEAWGTAFKTWDAVMPMTREDARAAKNPAPWFEFRFYMNRQVAGFFSFVQDTIRSVDPHARCGLSGTQSPEAADGMDWWLLSHAFSYYHSYNTGWSCEMRRSFHALAGGADQSPYFAGYSATDPGAENRMWWCLFHDTRGISAWKTGLFFYGDFTETQSGRDTKRHLDTFRRGLWRLVRHAKRQQDGIALLFSMPSITAGALTGDERRIESTRDAWVKLLEDSGLQYEFVSSPQIEGGILDKGLFRVLVLPFVTTMSERTADAVRAFVKAGGAVVATRLPGVRDGIGRPRRPALLADVFGVRGGKGAAPAVDPVVRLNASWAGLAADTEVRCPVADAGLRLAGGAARAAAGEGRVPALILGGNGRALLLNLDLGNYEQERRFHSPTEKRLRAVLLHFLAGVGVKPTYPITLESGRTPHIEVIRYADGTREYLCLLNGDSEPDTATLPLGRPRFVYDARSESFRGRISSLTVPLTPQCARVFRLCDRPAPPPRIILDAPRALRSSQAVGGGRVRFAVALARDDGGPELVRITVVDARNRERPELMQTIWTDGRPVTSEFPLALNDPPGDWTLTAAVVGTGAWCVEHVQVRP